MSYRHGKHHKTPDLIFCQQGLANRDFSDSLWKKIRPVRKGLELGEYDTDIEVIMKQLS